MTIPALIATGARIETVRDCPTCKGRGLDWDRARCSTCGGQRVLRGSVTVEELVEYLRAEQKGQG